MTLAGILAGCWRGGASSDALSPGRYVCTGNDSLRIRSLEAGEAAGPSRIRVALNGVPFGPLGRTGLERGSEYAGRGPTVLWAKGGTVLVERFGTTRAHGCRALPDSARRAKGEGDSDVIGDRPDAWFRSPTGLNRHGYLLKYPRPLDIDQHRLHHVRFRYAGPNNDPPALTDGFSLHIGLERTSPDTTLRAYARADAQAGRSVGRRRASSIRDTTIRGHEGLAWTAPTAMGPVAERLLVRLGPETLATISYSAVGARRKAYRRRVRQMLSTLRFQARSAAPSHVNVPLAMLSDPNGGAPGADTLRAGSAARKRPRRGCDEVVFVPHRVPLTADPLSAALDTLFAIDRDSVGGHRHFLARTHETLSLRHVSRTGLLPTVRLEGRLSGLRGVCDHPRARIQIVETARRVAATDSVALYLNGTPTDLQPSARGRNRGSTEEPGTGRAGAPLSQSRMPR